MLLPTRRTADILEQETDKELLIYDLRIDKAYNLNETLKTVYNVCDGQTSFDDLKRRYKYTDDLIHLALDELKANNLLENYASDHFAGLSRREVIKKVGLATLTALPLIAGITAPAAVQAASTCARNSCQSDAACAAPCRNCSGRGTCIPYGGNCTEIGNTCVSTGTCRSASGFAGYCQINNLPCSTPGGTCLGTGNCVPAGVPGLGICSLGNAPCFAVGAPCTVQSVCIPNALFCTDPNGSPCAVFGAQCVNTGTCNGTGTCV